MSSGRLFLVFCTRNRGPRGLMFLHQVPLAHCLGRLFSLVLVGAALLLGGCSTGLLGGGSKVGGPADVQNIQAGNQLTLPPDLSLPPPGQASNSYQAKTPQEGVYDSASLDPVPAAPIRRAPPAQGGDVYDQYNISKLKPDGTKKTQAELANELKVIQIAKKKQKNGNYGTVFNMGNIFNDQ